MTKVDMLLKTKKPNYLIDAIYTLSFRFLCSLRFSNLSACNPLIQVTLLGFITSQLPNIKTIQSRFYMIIMPFIFISSCYTISKPSIVHFFWAT